MALLGTIQRQTIACSGVKRVKKEAGRTLRLFCFGCLLLLRQPGGLVSGHCDDAGVGDRAGIGSGGERPANECDGATRTGQITRAESDV